MYWSYLSIFLQRKLDLELGEYTNVNKGTCKENLLNKTNTSIMFRNENLCYIDTFQKDKRKLKRYLYCR